MPLQAGGIKKIIPNMSNWFTFLNLLKQDIQHPYKTDIYTLLHTKLHIYSLANMLWLTSTQSFYHNQGKILLIKQTLIVSILDKQFQKTFIFKLNTYGNQVVFSYNVRKFKFLWPKQIFKKITWKWTIWYCNLWNQFMMWTVKPW